MAKMIGTFYVYSKKTKIHNINIPEFSYDSQTQLQKHFIGERSYSCLHIIKKFADEIVFTHENNLFICFDGLILNVASVLAKHHCDSLQELLTKAIRNNTITALLKEFRGTFSGVIHDFDNNEIIAFSDQLASKLLFYYEDVSYLILSTEVKSISVFLKQNDVKYELDMIGAYSLITYAYMYGDHTLINGVKRLKEGLILNYKNNKLSIDQYYRLKNEPASITEEEAIQKIEEKFTEALKLQVEMNKKHGMTDTIPLSAGMDCRMTSYVYRDLFNQPAINFTYSETGEADFVTPSQMAADLKNRWIFKNLDNGNDLFEIEKAIDISDGLVYYAWPAQLYDFLRLVDTRSWGIIHTGVVGDVVIGTFKKNDRFKEYFIGAGAYSEKLINKLKKLIGEIPVIDYELGMMSNRGINGACLGYSLTFRHFSEAMSPFLYIDFLELCLSIPYQMRQQHKLYYKWVKRYHPEATKFKHNGITIKGKYTFRYHGNKYRLRALPDLIRRKIRQMFDDHYGMNPVQGWYNHNESLRNCMDAYFENNKCVLQTWKELYNDTIELYNTGTALEKIQAISLVGSIKMLFGKFI